MQKAGMTSVEEGRPDVRVDVVAYRDAIDVRVRLRDPRRITEPRIDAVREFMTAIAAAAHARKIPVRVIDHAEEDSP